MSFKVKDASPHSSCFLICLSFYSLKVLNVFFVIIFQRKNNSIKSRKVWLLAETLI